MLPVGVGLGGAGAQQDRDALGGGPLDRPADVGQRGDDQGVGLLHEQVLDGAHLGVGLAQAGGAEDQLRVGVGLFHPGGDGVVVRRRPAELGRLDGEGDAPRPVLLVLGGVHLDDVVGVVRRLERVQAEDLRLLLEGPHEDVGLGGGVRLRFRGVGGVAVVRRLGGVGRVRRCRRVGRRGGGVGRFLSAAAARGEDEGQDHRQRG